MDIDAVFKAHIDRAQEHIKRILDTNKHPVLASEARHSYDDKYALAEFMVSTSIASHVRLLRALGATEEHLHELRQWAKCRTVTLRFTATKSCEFVREETRDVEGKTRTETKVMGVTVTNKVVTKVTEYYWRYTTTYRLSAFNSTRVNDGLTLAEGESSAELLTGSEKQPFPKVTSIDPIQVDVSWLLRHLNDDLDVTFSIDRDNSATFTPRRNPQVLGVLSSTRTLMIWARSVNAFIRNDLLSVEVNTDKKPDVTVLDDECIFVPVVPLMEEHGEDRIIDGKDVLKFLDHQDKTVLEAWDRCTAVFGDGPWLITPRLAHMVVLTGTMSALCESTVRGLDFVEEMIRHQLRSAIGKQITSELFTEYMEYHNRKIFRDQFEPRPFCYAIAREDHHPEGVISIDRVSSSSGVPDPVATFVSQSDATTPMYVELNAATRVAVFGKRFVHGYLAHHCESEPSATLQLTARARQFSCYMVLLGTIAADDSFDVKQALIVKDKDDVTAALDIVTLPSPKEFANAVQSLSDEQQRFATAIRSFQLGTSLFGVMVIDVKAQLERALNLSPDALTKEIKLTRHLLELFIEYQIPTDLLSFNEGDAGAMSSDEMVGRVRNHASELFEMIESTKEQIVADREMQTSYKETVKDNWSIQERLKMLDLKPKPKPRLKKRYGKRRSDVEDVEEEEVEVEVVDGDLSTQGRSNSSRHSSAGNIASLPVRFNAMLASHDVEHAVRPSIISLGSSWTRKYFKSLLAPQSSEEMGIDKLTAAKKSAFDLLDAMTRSGVLAIHDAQLHVVLSGTHCFADTLTETVIRKNVNPIEKLESSSLIIASLVHHAEPEDMLTGTEIDRVRKYSAHVFGGILQ